MSLKTLLLRNLIRYSKITNFAPIIIQRQSYNKNERYNWSSSRNTAVALIASVVIGSAAKEKENKKEDVEAGEKRPDLPTFTAEEVSKHDSKKSFWVIYKHGVYDVTSFLSSHPGGEQILNAAGLSIEPFWNVYGMHKTKEIYELLESYRIGNLHDDDVVDHSDDEFWAKEPYRDKRLIIKTAKPFNAEIPPKLQIEHFNTPNELFYVRQHMPVPDINENEHKLTVTIVGKTTTVNEFTMKDLSKFKPVTVNAALMCAGNRRSEMNKVKPVKGLSWTTGAISNAEWGGVLLRDVLLHCGLDTDNIDDKHVILTGADTDASGTQFSTSMPLRDALGGVLLATAMNGAPLPPDHGRPLRAVAPGAPAVRSVKWLQSITISTEESSSHWHQKDYRSFNPSTTWETADFSTAPPVYSLPVTSAICDPEDGETVTVKDGHIEVKGYAYSGGGAGVVRVDVSADGGASWRAARLRHAPARPAPPARDYAWTLWSARLPLAGRPGQVEIWVKATDSNFNTQPEKFDDIWNIRGILSNAYHKIKVNIKY
ncbi:sulfite oxidase, mitochondrial isoform X2 [Nymphalis io]|uniref:sulfite oxidase, mitochondrial isoform X2 n=1 Tax=Inachis io TaxID=171585 RepID=UPI002166D90D|nr:sulfite oxidase, mitochondrial isoform X2 [Nymphalis io]